MSSAVLEITEHHGNPEATRQAVDLLMDDRLEVVIVGMVRRRRRFGPARRRSAFVRAAPDCR
jgi:hypothetical protein